MNRVTGWILLIAGMLAIATPADAGWIFRRGGCGSGCGSSAGHVKTYSPQVQHVAPQYSAPRVAAPSCGCNCRCPGCVCVPAAAAPVAAPAVEYENVLVGRRMECRGGYCVPVPVYEARPRPRPKPCPDCPDCPNCPKPKPKPTPTPAPTAAPAGDWIRFGSVDANDLVFRVKAEKQKGLTIDDGPGSAPPGDPPPKPDTTAATAPPSPGK